MTRVNRGESKGVITEVNLAVSEGASGILHDR